MSPFDSSVRAQQPPHQHVWDQTPSLGPEIRVLTEYIRLGEVTEIEVTPSSEMDNDFCLNWWDCPFPFGWAQDTTHRLPWSDGNAGGQFGHLVDGHFVPTSDPDEVTHYKAPEYVAPGDVTVGKVITISLKIDDEGKSIDPTTGLEVETYNDPVGEGTAKLTAWEFTITDNSGLQGWRPEKYATVNFTAAITPETDHKGESMARFIRFKLWSSMEPGYCLNATREVGAWDDTSAFDRDLKFLSPDPDGFYVTSSDEMGRYRDIADTLERRTIATVPVRCLDYGAYGWISAEATIAGYMPQGAKRKDKPTKTIINIPIDEASGVSNHIADSWEEVYGFPTFPPEWDSEYNPITGDNANHDNFTGDGFTYYEEYRGLEVNGGWQTLGIQSKDIFVYDVNNLGTGGYSQSGLGIFRSTRAGEMDAGNVVNFFRMSHTLGPQHGLRLVNENGTNDCQQGRWGWTTGGPGRPGNVTRVSVCVNNIQGQLNQLGLNQQIQDAINDAIAHELAHGSFVWHHGDNPIVGWPNHQSGNATHVGNNPADSYDGDLCIMRPLHPLNFLIPADYCTTICVPFPMPNHLQCKYHFDVRDAARNPNP